MFLSYSGSHSHTHTVPASCVFTKWIHTKSNGNFESLGVTATFLLLIDPLDYQTNINHHHSGTAPLLIVLIRPTPFIIFCKHNKIQQYYIASKI